MKSKIIFLTLFLSILLSTTAFAAPDISSPSAILMDSKTGQILYEKNVDTKHYPASITKVMTALLLLEAGDLDQIVEINDDVPTLIEPGSSQIYLIPGEKLTREQLLYALLVDSANDAAVAIAQDIAGSVENFAVKMNEKAKELGANNTHFVNPHGLHDDNHYTTARDMAIIAREAMKNSTFQKIVTTERYIIPATNKQDTRYLYISNRLIRKTTYRNYYYEGATGIKTGYTTRAGHTLIGGASKDNLDLITVVLDSNAVDVYEDTHKLLNYGFENFQNEKVLNKGDVVKEIYLEDVEESLSLVATSSLEYSIAKDETQESSSSLEIPDELSLPINKGDVIGKMVYYIDGQEIATISLAADKSIEAPHKILYFLSNGSNILKILGILLILFLLYRTHVYIKKKKRRAKYMYSKKYKGY